MYQLMVLLVGLTIVGGNSEKTFSYARDDCHSQNKELLSLSTKQEYDEVHDYLYHNDISWLALQWNGTLGNWQWINGRILSKLFWKPWQPKSLFGEECGVVDVYSKTWYTARCSEPKLFVCIDQSAQSYTVEVGKVDFHAAQQRCREEEKNLPLAINNLQVDYLNKVISQEGLTDDIWLGIIEQGNYYTWVSGQELQPTYNMDVEDNAEFVHFDYDSNLFHITAYNKEPYICQTPAVITVSRPPIKSRYDYIYVTDKAYITEPHRKEFLVKTRTRCAVECTKDAGCFKYTTDGYRCKTYGDVMFFTDPSGSRLWKRKYLNL